MQAGEQDLKARAWARWEALGWPTTRLEAWRNFSTRTLTERELRGGITPAEAGAALAAEAVVALPKPRVVLVDGRRAPALDDLQGLAVGVEVGGIDGRVPIDRLTPEDGALEALNTALLGDGVAVRVPVAVAGGVLHVVHLVTGHGTAHVRTLVEVERGATLTLVSHHRGLGGAGPSFVNAVTECLLHEEAALALGKCVREGASGSHLEAVHAEVRAGGRLSSFTLVAGGERARTGVTVTLAGEGASADVDGLYLGRGQDKLDHVTAIRHAVGGTRSAQTWAGVLDERAEGGFQGVIHIAAGASGSATRQLTRTLLLSNEAEAHARPELHIDCDEVEASHGATVGQLDAMARFYLESRGIPPEEARRILIRAFVDGQLGLLPEAVRAVFAAAVAEVLGPGQAVEERDDEL